jgi:hypothetical protein
VGSRAGLYGGGGGGGGEEKNSQLQPGLEHPIIQPVAQRYNNELSRVLLELSTSCYLNKHVLTATWLK